jgi:ubiquinone/menaquinone biosynthesis C-methylase UbiE
MGTEPRSPGRSGRRPPPAASALPAAQATYDRLSRFYDALAASSEGPFIAAALEKLGPVEEERVLEIGFGTGRALAALAQAPRPPSLASGLDLSAGMCAAARTRLRRAGLWDRLSLQQGDARQLPYAAGTLDAILMTFTLELLSTPDIAIVLGECRRALRDRGRLCLVALSRDEGLGLLGRPYDWLHHRFPRLLDCRPIPARSLVAGACFRLVDSEIRSMWGLPVAIVLARKAEGQPPPESQAP